jgi:hypothetical protein
MNVDHGYYVHLEVSGGDDPFYITMTFEIRDWCNSNIGRQKWQWYGKGSKHPDTIRFETSEDALAFKLRFDIKG